VLALRGSSECRSTARIEGERIVATQEVLHNVRTSVERVQNFDPNSVGWRGDLGRLSFEEAVPNTSRVVELFQRINLSSLVLFADGHLNQIRQQADAAYNLLQRMIEFDPEKTQNAADDRRNIISELSGALENYAGVLAPHIAYSVASSLDPTATQQEMRAVLQQFADQRDAALKEVQSLKQSTEEV
jgi:hypothetical protein